MDDAMEYRQAVADLLATTIQEQDARRALSEACKTEGDSDFDSAFAQAKRHAVYAASEAREEAAERYVIRWRRVTKRVINENLAVSA